MISVVIPTYNRQHLVLDALDSVRAQDVRPIEIIVVDDGSTDDTVAAINKWARENVDVGLRLEIVSQQNLGGNAARNAGIRASSAELVAFLDSDDTWHREKLKKQQQYIQVPPEVGAVYCGLEEVDADSGAVLETPVRSYPQGELFPEILVQDITAPTSCYLLRRHVFETVGYFDEALEARQDWDMWIRVARDFRIGAVPENLVQFRRHNGARTASDPRREIRAYQDIRAKYRDWLEGQSKRLQRRALGAYHRRLGRVHFHRNLSWSQALSHSLRACIYAPWTFDSYAALVGLFLPRSLRQSSHRAWNRLFGKTSLAIRSH